MKYTELALIIVLISDFLFVPNAANAGCLPSELDVCTKLKLIHSEIQQIPHLKIVRGKVKKVDSVKFCVSTLEDIFDGKIFVARTVECPKMETPKYLSIKFACNDTDRPPEPDHIDELAPEECEREPEANLARINGLLNQISAGKTNSELKKFGFRYAGERIAVNSPAENKHTSDTVVSRVLHSFPGVSIDLQVVQCWPPECNNTTLGDYWKVTKIDQVRQEFVSKRECLMWGGKPGTRREQESQGLRAGYQDFVAASCSFEGKPEAVRQYFTETLQGIGLVPDKENVTILSAEAGKNLYKECKKEFSERPSEFWVPKAGLIKDADAVLFGPEQSKGIFGGKSGDPKEFVRQYVGYFSSGKPYLHADVIPLNKANAAKKDWRSTPLSGCKGGAKAWSITMDANFGHYVRHALWAK